MRARSTTLSLALVAVFSQPACKPAAPPPPPPAPVVARVDGAPILLASLQREVTRVRRSEEEGSGAPATLESSSAPVEIARAQLGPLIDRELLAAHARAAGLTVPEADVQRATDALADDARSAGQSFGERLAKDEESAAALHDQTREQLLAERAIASEVHVEPPSLAEIKAWAEAHKSDFEQPDEVRAAQILVASPEEAKSVLDQLRAGVRFDVLAREHSLSPDARRGGDLGFFPKGVMPPPFDEVCFSLKPGQLSGIVRSDYGFHIFKLLEKRAARRRTLGELAPSIGERLFREKRTAAEAAWLQSLRAQSQISIDESVLAQIR